MKTSFKKFPLIIPLRENRRLALISILTLTFSINLLSNITPNTSSDPIAGTSNYNPISLINSGTFPSFASIVSVDSLVTGFNGAYDSQAVDVDGDGDLDVLGSVSLDGEVSWFENDGTLSFTKHVIDINLNDPRGIEGNDIDGDLDIDIIVSVFTGDSLLWYENDGNENFTRHLIDGDLNGVRESISADVNGDGDTDIITVASSASQIAWYENDGNESFTKAVLASSFNLAYNIDTSDVDDDGDLDVVAAAVLGNEMAWFENDGNGVFTKQSLTTSFLGAIDIQAVDLDDDGDIDFIGCGFFNETIAWWENDGNEIFTEATISVGKGMIGGIDYSDINGDGDMDILFHSDDNVLGWFENDGGENFEFNALYDPFSASRFKIVDMDGDDNDDILAAGNSAVFILKNVPVGAPLVSSDSDNTICDGESVTFSYSGGTNYQFFVNNNSVQNGSSSSFTTSTLSDNDVIKVTVTDGSGCMQTSLDLIISVTGSCDELVISGRDITCIDYPVQIYTLEGKTSGATYNWIVEGSNTSITDGQSTDEVEITFANTISAYIDKLIVEETFNGFVKKDTMDIGVAHPNVCVYSNCAANSHITTAVLGVTPTLSVFNVDQVLTSDGVVANKDLTFIAGQSIELQPGFTVNQGRQLVAEVTPCIPD